MSSQPPILKLPPPANTNRKPTPALHLAPRLPADARRLAGRGGPGRRR